MSHVSVVLVDLVMWLWLFSVLRSCDQIQGTKAGHQRAAQVLFGIGIVWGAYTHIIRQRSTQYQNTLHSEQCALSFVQATIISTCPRSRMYFCSLSFCWKRHILTRSRSIMKELVLWNENETIWNGPTQAVWDMYLVTDVFKPQFIVSCCIQLITSA